MTITLLAPDGVPVTAMQERQAKAALNGGGFGRALGGRSGFRVGTDITTLVSTPTQWTLKPCAAQLDPGASTHQGMYGWSSDADVTGALTAPDATYARKDIVYIRVDDSSAGDGSGATQAPVVYLAGTPAASPVAPTLPARSFLIGTINVPQVGGGSPTVTLNPARFVAAGGVLPVATAADRPPNPYVGLKVCRLDRDGWEQTYTGVGTSGWEYQRQSRRVYATVNATNFANEVGSDDRLVYTMPSTGLTKSYAQTVNVGARIALSCPPITSGSLQEWLAVSSGASAASAAQGRASTTFTVSTATVLQTLQADTGPLSVAAGVDPLARLWIQRPTASALDTTVSTDPTFTQMWIDLRPQDD